MSSIKQAQGWGRHLAYDRIASRLPLPWLHIADAVADEAARRGYRRLGILGTQPLVESGLYDDRAAAAGLAAVQPTRAEREALDRLIFGELTRGVASPSGREQLRAITRRLRDEEGCDAVALVCTELPLLVDPADPPALPALDSARILAEAALRRVCGPARAL